MRLISLLVLASLSTGCVTKKVYDTELNRAANLSMELATRSAELARARDEVDRLTGALAAAEGRGKELDALSTELTSRNDELQKSLADLQGKLETMASRSAQDKAAKAELEKMLGELSTSAKEAETRIQDARNRMAEMEKEQQRLAEEAARLAAEKAQLEAKTAEYGSLVKNLEKEIEAGQVTITELSGRLTVNLSNAILFESGSFSLKPEGAAALQKVAEVLKGVTTRTVRVEGHTDNVPVNAGAAYADNWALSSLRASTVVSLLVKAGVDPLNVASVGWGEFHPLRANDTAEGKAANRRTEIVLEPRLFTAPVELPEAPAPK